MPDVDGYPIEEELKAIREWDITEQGLDGFVELIREAWNHGYGSFTIIREPDELDPEKQVKFLVLSTGGWSGNESVMEAIGEEKWFNFFCWEESRRGGHYKFKLLDCFPCRKPKELPE